MVSELTGQDGKSAVFTGLNPCFSGRWYRSETGRNQMVYANLVLILVLVEDGIGVNLADYDSKEEFLS